MIYEFRNTESGEIVEFDYAPDECPLIGARFERDGATYQKLPPGSPEIYVNKLGDQPFVSTSLPKNYEPHKQAGGKFDSKGHPVFESKRQVQRTERAARNFSEHDNIQHPGLKPFGRRG